MAQNSAEAWKFSNGNAQVDVVNKIRFGAARQHVNAVLIYQVFSKEKYDDNILSIGKVTILGGFILPSKTLESQGSAEGLLIDVVQGYPYGTIQTTVEKDTEYSSAWGWGSSSRYDSDFTEQTKTKAVLQLSIQAEAMFQKLRKQLEEQQEKKTATIKKTK